MKSLKIYMVRHGRSRGNREGVYIGWTDTPLDPEGAEQIQAVKAALPERFDAVYVSPLLRTRQSADILVGPGGYSLCEGIKETHFGTWEGMNAARIAAEYPQDWEAWQRDWIDTVPPGGESARQAYDRIRAALADILAAHEQGQVLLVTHGGVIRLLLCQLLEVEMEKSWHYRLDPGGMALVEMVDGYGVLRRLGD